MEGSEIKKIRNEKMERDWESVDLDRKQGERWQKAN